MAQLPRQHHDLASMMTFVGHEIREHVPNVEREIAPDVRRCRWDLAVPLAAEIEKARDSFTATVQCSDQLDAADTTPIHARWNRDTVRSPQRFDPRAARVVDVAADHAHRASWSTGDSSVPKDRRQLLDEKDRGAVVRGPRVDNAVAQRRRRYDPAFRILLLTPYTSHSGHRSRNPVSGAAEENG